VGGDCPIQGISICSPLTHSSRALALLPSQANGALRTELQGYRTRDAAAVPPSAPQAVMESWEGAASATAAAAAPAANDVSPGGGSSNRVHPQRSNIILPTIAVRPALQLESLAPAESGSRGEGGGGGVRVREPRARPAHRISGSTGDESPSLSTRKSPSTPVNRRGSLLGLNITTTSLIEKVWAILFPLLYSLREKAQVSG
jgi:hypothetical protein